jgi:hypothetical protein
LRSIHPFNASPLNTAADNYVPFFEQAADMVLEVCDDYVPT